jgi:hypothetical protein
LRVAKYGQRPVLAPDNHAVGSTPRVLSRYVRQMAS